MTADDLRIFEAEVKQRFESRLIPGPVHLSNGNEDQLVEIFQDIKPTDWVFSTWRNHLHALLHGIPKETVLAEIMAGRSISMNSKEHRFMSSAIVGGMLPIAVGIAAAIKNRGETDHCWCFVGDMAASAGMFHDCAQYAYGFDLPITFVIEDNGFSTNTPTASVWGGTSHIIGGEKVRHYFYERLCPHVGSSYRMTM